MKRNKLKTLSLLALAGLVSLPSAKAATFVTGDLILGFRSPTNTPGSVVEVNLGSSASFAANDAASFLPVININDVLTAAFGGSWATSSDLRGGIAGTPGGTSFFASRVQTTVNPGTDQSSNPGSMTTTNFNSAVNNIGSYVGAFASLGTPAVTLYNGGLSFVSPIANNNTYEDWATGTSTFGVTAIHPGDDNFAAGASNFSLDIYEVVNTGASRVSTWQGTFHMDGTGQVYFSSTAVPEPGRAALGLIGAMGLLLRRRRRS